MRSNVVSAVVLGTLVFGGGAALAQDVGLRLNTAVADPEDRVIASASDLNDGCSFIVYGEPRVEGNRVLIEGVLETLPILCAPGVPKRHSFELPQLPVGDHTVEAVVDGETVDSAPLQIRERTELLLRDLGFRVEVVWDDPRVGTGQGKAVPLTDESGGFWFFDEENLEVTVKVLNGRALNQHFWVFIASMTDVGFTLKVRWLNDPCLVIFDPPPGPDCADRIYVQAPGENRNILDTAAFRGFGD